ncbi:MAG: hypothetical protein ACRECE_07765 [Xanthobacteraceae bacterium]
MQPFLRLYEDVLSSDAAEIHLPPLPRMIFVAHGSVAMSGRAVHDGEVSGSAGTVSLKAGSKGAALWRWEMVSADGVAGTLSGHGVYSLEKLGARLETVHQGPLLLRGDSVAFPPGGCAYLHRHQGPGIRCLLEGGIRIDTHGRSTCYGPGGAWYESGPDPVFAQAADRPTRFIRAMILPASYLGKSSVEYLREEDKAKPKSQQYKIFVDMMLTVIPAEWSESRNP